MDELDTAIVRELQRNARLSNRELAARLGIAASTCLLRTRALCDRGIISGFHAHVDLDRVGRGVQAMLSVQVRPLSRPVIESFKAFALGLPEVLSVFVLTGGDDFLIHLAVPDVNALHSLLMDQFSTRKEVIGFRTSVIFQHAERPAVL